MKTVDEKLGKHIDKVGNTLIEKVETVEESTRTESNERKSETIKTRQDFQLQLDQLRQA